MLAPSIFNGMDSLFDDFFDFDRFDRNFGKNFGYANNQLMNTDVKETDNEYQLEMELPGFNKEDLHAELSDGYLMISAEHKESKDDKDEKGKYIRRERSFGKCQRSFYIGEDVKQEDIKASFENGILTLKVPKVEKKPAVEEKHYIAIEG
jgi:HSP20 family molecular chaperone IbpA